MKERVSIFVSAVSSEFRSFRQGVRDVLLTRGIFPIVQDNLPPDYREVRTMLTDHISAADAVICLIGFAYGAEPKNRPDGEPRRSYTQLEYHIARELNKPVFVFLSDENVRPCDAPPDDDDERRALQLAHRTAVTAGDELWHVFKARDELETRIAEIPIVAQVGFRISSGRLRHGARQELVGREKELGDLDTAWDDPKTHVVSIVAWGGVGKTALVVEWMARMARDDWRGAERVFDWSFYSQGTSDTTQASSDRFLAKAMEFFGDPDPKQGSPWDKGERLAALVAEHRTLLVLDGVEPLQHPPGPMTGKLKDQALEALLKGLAQRNAGLCLVTTRESLTDLAPFDDTTAPAWPLEHLSDEAGAHLLFQAGVKRAGNADIQADDKELKDATHDVNGHALTLNLLGRYLARAHGGDIRRRDKVKFKKADARVQGGHAFKVMKAYVKWLGEGVEDGARQLAVLHLLGLFDRPADPGCLAALRAEPVIEALTEPLVGLGEEDWNYTLSNLDDCGFVATHADESATGDAPLALDAHPLVREYFAAQLRQDRPEAWQAAHRRLYEHLTQSTEHQPDTLAGLAPLYQAVAHGCLAGMYEEARANVYRDRILRGTGPDGFYSTKKLGAFGSDLAAVACFFETPWTTPAPQLSESAQAWLLNEAAFCLRAPGRLTEAAVPMRAGLEVAVKQEDWRNAAIRAGNLSELELTLGQVARSVADAACCVDYADHSGDAFQRMSKRTTQADALFQSGHVDEAAALFEQAEAMQAERQPTYPLLYSLWSFRYCDLLLAPAERTAWQRLLQLKTQDSTRNTAAEACHAVRQRATQTLEWVTAQRWLLDIALDHLSLGRAALYHAILTNGAPSAGHESLDRAVAGLRRAGPNEFVARGLLNRVLLRFVEDDKDACQADVDEAGQIAERGSMKLFMADVHLHRARLFHNKAELAEAKKLIDECGYHRRDPELHDAEQAAQDW